MCTIGSTFIISVTLILLSPLALAERVIYVNGSAVGANNGTTWEDAYTDLQDALADAETNGGCPCEIWVARGRYTPDRGTGDRWAHFELLEQGQLYGGFVGFETNREDRDWIVNETILSGDLLGDDAPNAVPTSNCCFELNQPSCDNQECTELVAEVNPASPPCDVFWYGQCPRYAHIVCCELCRPTRCDNSQNIVRIVGVHEGVVLDGFTVRGGEENCTFEPDCPVPNAPGLLAISSTFTVRNCFFTDHLGIALEVHSSNATVAQSRFIETDYERFHSLAIDIKSSLTHHSEISDCVFEDNHGASVVFRMNGSIRRSVFSGNRGALGVGSSGTMVRVEECMFKDNSGASSIVGVSSAFVTFENCSFLGNNAYNSVLSNNTGAVTINNCIFSGNTDQAISNFLSMSVRNCSIHANSNPGGTTGGINNSGNLTVRNSVLWGNSGPLANSTFQEQIYNFNGTYTLLHNAIEGLPPEADSYGNVGHDPLFVDPFGPDNMKGTLDDNLRLAAESPLINVGQPEPTFASYQDADGHARFLCGRIDMGAYEFGIGDYNCDRVIEPADFAAFPQCMTGPHGGPYVEMCEAYDFRAEVEDRIDLLDFAGMQNGAGP